ncbi:homoprotocatechuate degradation operon regulator HpaR [Massilia sp. BSC265]|uniref:homoprotocatechuate degradation operon regulator HpaR n=1 Tax=Massilia sp. BSC265 TaxID=1549812 RepID=UPI0004E9073F|nr:homoprotocatechuate degradation operon regulator HpaR [Massilia sp. BSC265]KFI08464.1 MarR family transcriptional regulator [Massilia sp. BSC265]
MSRRITNRDLPQQLLIARDVLMSHFRPVLNHFGVTEQQWRILRALDEHGQLEPRELCELCRILSPSMAGVLARMEEMGLVRRRRVAADARRVMVRLTPQGDSLFDEIAPLIERQYRLMEKAWGKRVLDDVSAALAGFIAAQATPVAQVELPEDGRQGQQAGE